ncbi:uncharacterized protein DUF4377 [Luteibacter rhizovicinus]|uniref:Uncharacterized protein DUF4377 n=1 Tax=Luteibacter rhizovicinus TaxID=242606 RepID=A0A4R3YJ01_9GAMM|nr:DUF4377 domain-containing protein [Luteibacter rhizovicinus]TCV92032.1 uncharacterized protein DUF4377 [Luteibacter rhizovicinus]
MRMLLLALTLTLAGCATMESDHGSRTRLIYVAASKAPCSAGVMKTECMQIREEPSKPWELSYTPIENFNYEPGNEYLLKITETHVANPPADASAVRWRVEKIVEQHPVH